MKQKKTRGNESEDKSKYTENIWKDKAVFRQGIIKQQNKRILELEKSRDLWKSKYKQGCSKSDISGLYNTPKAGRHQYSILLVLLLVQWHTYGSMSLRSCRHCLCELCLLLGLNCRLPSASTIRLWVCKAGYHRVNKVSFIADSYVIYVDESILIGGQKILLVIGVLESQIMEKRSLEHRSMKVLWVESSSSWKGADIALVLEKVAQKHQIAYVVSDNGTNLKSAYESMNYVHIQDCTHKISNILERIYKDDVLLETFSKEAKSLRKRWFLSKDKAIYLAPTQRGKVRFANIFPTVHWAANLLKIWADLPENIQKELNWLLGLKDLVSQMICLEKVIGQIYDLLKNKGFNSLIKKQLDVLLWTLAIDYPSQKTLVFVDKVWAYLAHLESKSLALGRSEILCCSDIIETFFGKFKAKISQNSPKKMTEFIYTIANFGPRFTEEEIKEALEKFRIYDLKKTIYTKKTG